MFSENGLSILFLAVENLSYRAIITGIDQLLELVFTSIFDVRHGQS